MAFTEKYVSALAAGGGNGNSEGTAYTWAEMLGVFVTNGINYRYNIKADGNYTRTGYDDSSGASGGNAGPIYIRGYKTTPGDGYLGRDANGALITTNMPVLIKTGDIWYTPKGCVVESINVQGNRGDSVFGIHEKSYLVASVVSNSASDGRCLQTSEWSVCFECDFLLTATSSTREVINADSGSVRLDSCRIISSVTSGTNFAGIRGGQNAVYYGCLIKGAGFGTGIRQTDNNRFGFYRNCTITGWVDALKYESTTDLATIIAGCMITDNSGYAISIVPGNNFLIGPNRTRDNVLGDVNGTTNWAQTGRIIPIVTTDTGGPTSDYAADYTLISTSPGIAQNRPKFSDMGAYGMQHPTGGGGGTAVFNPLAQTIIRPAP